MQSGNVPGKTQQNDSRDSVHNLHKYYSFEGMCPHRGDFYMLTFDLVLQTVATFPLSCN